MLGLLASPIAGRCASDAVLATKPGEAADVEQTSPPLDVATPKERLREAKAIGFFTKLKLKNEVDDLLAALRRLHNSENEANITELRERYDLLLMKVLTLLQDEDHKLAQDISESRKGIWKVLSDPAKLDTV